MEELLSNAYNAALARVKADGFSPKIDKIEFVTCEAAKECYVSFDEQLTIRSEYEDLKILEDDIFCALYAICETEGWKK